MGRARLIDKQVKSLTLEYLSDLEDMVMVVSLFLKRKSITQPFSLCTISDMHERLIGSLFLVAFKSNELL